MEEKAYKLEFQGKSTQIFLVKRNNDTDTNVLFMGHYYQDFEAPSLRTIQTADLPKALMELGEPISVAEAEAIIKQIHDYHTQQVFDLLGAPENL